MAIDGLPFAYLCTAAPASSVAAQSATASLEALLRDVRALNQEMDGSLVGRATAVESTDSSIQDDAQSPLGALVRNVDALRKVLHSDENKKQKSPIGKFGIAGGKGPEAFNPENPIRKGFRAYCLSVG